MSANQNLPIGMVRLILVRGYRQERTSIPSKLHIHAEDNYLEVARLYLSLKLKYNRAYRINTVKRKSNAKCER